MQASSRLASPLVTAPQGAAGIFLEWSFEPLPLQEPGPTHRQPVLSTKCAVAYFLTLCSLGGCFQHLPRFVVPQLALMFTYPFL